MKLYGKYIFSRIDYFLVSFGISNLVSNSSIKPSILTDHSMISMSLDLEEYSRGPGYWKLNCSFLSDIDYVRMVKDLVTETTITNEGASDTFMWELIKLNVRGESIRYSARKKKSRNITLEVLKRRLDHLYARFDTHPTEDLERDINLVKENIHELVDIVTAGQILRSKINLLENDEKPSKYFLNLEKRNYNKKSIYRLQTQAGIITGKHQVAQELKMFYSSLYKSTVTNNIDNPHGAYLNQVNVPLLSENEKSGCEGKITETELLSAMKNMNNGKSPGYDGFPIEFYKVFWHDIKSPLLNSLNASFERGEMSDSQKSGIISLLPKKEKDTLFIKNWRPLTLLNCDYKLATKCIASRLKNVLPCIINEDQTGFLKGRYIGENI